MNNEIYEKPVAEVVQFPAQDIITTSGGDSGVDLPFHPWD